MEPRVIIIDGDEAIELDSDGMEVRSDEEEPTPSDIEFIAPDEEVEAEILLSETVCEELDAGPDLVELPPHRPRLCRQCTTTAYARDIDGPDDDDDYEPDSGDDGDYDEYFSDED